MINNFVEIVSRSFNKLCNEKHTIIMREKDIAEVIFKEFSIVLYYCAYEYDLGINYRKGKAGKEYSIEQILHILGLKNEQIPKYKYMSNAEVMQGYIEEYIVIINEYFKELSSITNL